MVRSRSYPILAAGVFAFSAMAVTAPVAGATLPSRMDASRRTDVWGRVSVTAYSMNPAAGATPRAMAGPSTR